MRFHKHEKPIYESAFLLRYVSTGIVEDMVLEDINSASAGAGDSVVTIQWQGMLTLPMQWLGMLTIPNALARVLTLHIQSQRTLTSSMH
ncbi:hypothetical protein ACX0G7_08955 [Flavitalea antarctica]